MQTAAGPDHRLVCMTCFRPISVCYCAHIQPIDTKTRVLLLQHPRERDKAIGTARMASLCLPNSQLCVGVDWQNSAELNRAIDEAHGKIALLYPGDESSDVSTLADGDLSTLVVVDGTWWQTRKMVRTNPKLSALPRVTFTPERPSEYRIRKEPAEECVSTIEALMYVLGALEGTPERFHALRAPFRAMVDAQIACRDRLQGARIRKRSRPRIKSSPIPSCLRERKGDLVCVIGEANAWPYCCPERGSLYPDELVHWVAVRAHTGEIFERVIRPSNPLATNTTKHIELVESDLLSGSSLADLLTEFGQFLRPSDILCSWGCYATSLYLKGGGTLPQERYDLRVLSHAVEKRKLGALENYENQVDELAVKGRAGRRLAKLAAIVRDYATR